MAAALLADAVTLVLTTGVVASVAFQLYTTFRLGYRLLRG